MEEVATLTVLRAAATIGDVFEVEALVRLLEIPPLRVLGRLQAARDDGAPLTDTGDGRFTIDPVFAADLRASTLPSVAAAWRAALAEEEECTCRPRTDRDAAFEAAHAAERDGISERKPRCCERDFARHWRDGA